MVLNGFAPVYMVPMQTNIGLFCGRSYPGCMFGGPQLGYYLEITTSLDIHIRGLVVSLSAQPCFCFFGFYRE